jgi:hypothetical protein
MLELMVFEQRIDGMMKSGCWVMLDDKNIKDIGEVNMMI